MRLDVLKMGLAICAVLLVPATALAQPPWQELELEFQERHRERERAWDQRQAQQRDAIEAQAAFRRECAEARARLEAVQPVYITADSSYRSMDSSDAERLGSFVDQRCSAQ